MACANPLLDVVFRLQEPEPPAPVGDVAGVVGQLLDEVVHLVDERRDEQVADQGQEPEGEQERDRGGGPPSLEPVPLEPLDGGVQSQGQEQRDQDPRQYVARDPDHLEQDRDRDDRREQRQHGPQPEADEALRDHPPRIAAASDVRYTALGSLGRAGVAQW